MSCFPPCTVPAWKCYSTGLDPSAFGVYGFFTADFKNQRMNINNSRSFKHLELWDYLNWKGLRTAIINMPTMYPPKPIDGYIIGSIDALVDYTYPPDFEKMLRRELNYKTVPVLQIEKDDPGDILDELVEMTRTRFQVAMALKEEVPFMHLTIHNTDRILHDFGDNSQFVRALWEYIDKRVPKLIEGFDNVLLMSDHGHMAKKNVVPFNTWLRESGFLKTSAGGVKRRRLEGYLPWDVIPRTVQKFLKSITRSLHSEERVMGIKWKESSAVCSDINVVNLNPATSKGVKREVREEISKIDCVERVRTPAEIYGKGGHDTLIIECKEGHCLLPNETNFPRIGHMKTMHRREGIFALYGRDFAQRGNIGDADIYDLAPTILKLYGIDNVQTDGRTIEAFSSS